jgi:hypothetical protein
MTALMLRSVDEGGVHPRYAAHVTAVDRFTHVE